MSRINPIGGYTGRILVVDLSKGKHKVNKLSSDIISAYIGGRGFTSKIQYDENTPRINPLSPDNVLVFATGPLTGVAPCGSRLTVGAKSPLTGILGDSNSGGFWGPQLKFAGYDALIIRGKSTKPVYIWIDNGSVEIRDAENIWGKDSFEASRIIKKETKDKEISVLTIGPAGENLVKYACVMFDEGSGTAGRTGMGAVMGSKKLKAIAVRGDRGIKIAHPDKFFEAFSEIMRIMKSDPITSIEAPKFGTTMWIHQVNEAGGLCTRNYQTTIFDGIDKVSGETIRNKYLIKANACHLCPVRCRRTVKVPSTGTILTKVDFYSVSAFGPRCGNDNIESIFEAIELCDRLGMDIGSTSQCTAFAMECFEKGLITLEDTGGLPLDWGNSESILKLIRMIAAREGFGDLLAEGEKEVALGIKGSEKFAIRVKGLSPEVMDPRVFKLYSFRIAIASIGATHLRGQGTGGLELDTLPLEEGMRRLLYNEVTCNLTDMMGVCKLAYGIWSSSKNILEAKARIYLTKLYNAATGINLGVNDLAKAAERVLNLERAYVVREGLTRKDDPMPERFIKEPVPEGPAKGNTYDKLEEYLNKYYELREWDLDTGIPTHKKLEELGLKEVSGELEKAMRERNLFKFSH